MPEGCGGVSCVDIFEKRASTDVLQFKMDKFNVS
jgi:hypothetical protein